MQKMLALLGAKSKEEFVALLAQFIKFGLVGVSNTAVSMAVYYIFLWISPDLYMVGSVLGTILSIANAFFWNDKFVFTGNANDWRSKLKRLGKTYVSYGGTSILSNVLLWIGYVLQRQQNDCADCKFAGHDSAEFYHQQVVDI